MRRLLHLRHPPALRLRAAELTRYIGGALPRPILVIDSGASRTFGGVQR